MGWFRRLGLQRRIMLYVGLGLATMFVVGAYLGLLSIRQATELVYQERLGTASTTAAILEHNLRELVHQVEAVQNRLLRVDSPEELEQIGRDLFGQVSADTSFPFVRAQGVSLLDREGRVRLVIPSPAGVAVEIEAGEPWKGLEGALLLPARASSPSESNVFGTLQVPVTDGEDEIRWTAVLTLVGLNRDEPYFLPPSRAREGDLIGGKSSDAYNLEVLGPDGRVLLTRGGKTPAGKVSPHWTILGQHAWEPSSSFVFLHKPQKGQTFPAHMVAVVPLSSGPLTILLQQGEDVALALPLRLRQRLILFSSLGFLATMVVAWITTRHVVKPTERLTVAARHIAEGKVETPIRVAAQDEIGTLAESLEIMRRRLQAWGSELEKQVQERTAELQERNRELRMLYETLQHKEEQLHTLLGKVLGAQEEERRRVSRELHDGIGQALSALTLGLESLEQAGGDPRDGLQEDVERLKGLARETLSDLRRLTVALRPAALDDLGLVPAIRRYAELYLGDAGVAFQIQDELVSSRLDLTVETVIYRVVQEAINNVVRHSGATQATINLQATDDMILVSVADNGRGFQPSFDFSTEGVGLQGMRERASLAGGRLTLDTGPGRGTAIRLEIPITRRPGSPSYV
ncbi:MAG: HAMP domain-containing protein [Chloroflexi bacterium]|nr:HAMP domain-containing protein [Chloroflexota bacterium]